MKEVMRWAELGSSSEGIGWGFCLWPVSAWRSRPDLLQDATERVLQGVLNALVIVLEVAMTAIANTVARNGQLLENLMVLGFIIFGLKIVFRGLFRKSSKK